MIWKSSDNNNFSSASSVTDLCSDCFIHRKSCRLDRGLGQLQTCSGCCGREENHRSYTGNRTLAIQLVAAIYLLICIWNGNSFNIRVVTIKITDAKHPVHTDTHLSVKVWKIWGFPVQCISESAVCTYPDFWSSSALTFCRISYMNRFVCM